MARSRQVVCRSRGVCARRVATLAFLGTLLVGSVGCTAISNPVYDGIPARLVPQELLAPRKGCTQTVPLCALGQPKPAAYQLDAGDVLGVYVEGFLGDRAQPLPVHVAPPVRVPEQQRLAPGVGYPVPIDADGTVSLPSVPPLPLRGLTIEQARVAVRDHYVKQKLIRVENARVHVSLLHPRQTQVLVFRQEAQVFQTGLAGPVPVSKRNTGRLVDLPAYQNDVLNALVRSGGLPELDACNSVLVYRNGCGLLKGRPDVLRHLETPASGADLARLYGGNGPVVRIPLRATPGAPLPFGPADVLLHPGDVVFLEARDEEVFFTAGLLPPGKHVLPRDQDLDVIEAIAQTRGALYNAAFGGSNLSGTLLEQGIGNPSPSLLVVLRRMPGRKEHVPIVVDLREALRHPQERLLVRAGDVLILQEKPAEAFARYVTRSLFNFDIFWAAFRTSNGVGVIDVGTPDRLPSRVGFFTLPTAFGASQ